jgi:methylenetetrahydrofolate reductase (NADPH)
MSCPKAMVHGPCGGVRDDGGCEVDDRACPFAEALPDVALPPTESAELGEPARALLALAARRPIVVAHLPAVPLDREAQRVSAQAVAGSVDAALLGDAPWARVQLPPVLRAQLVAAEGVRPWPVLTCRDRNRVALESELAGLREVGVAAVHCVTGDYTTLGHRADAQPVFDLDSTRLAALAAGFGMVVSVAEAPDAPPVEERPRRLAHKVACGARVCFVDHCGGPAAVEEFVAAARALDDSVRFIVCVPVATSSAALARLRAFARRGLPQATTDAVDQPDPVGAGVRAAVAVAEDMLAIDGVIGVDLSAPAGPGEELRLAAALSLAADALGGGT